MNLETNKKWLIGLVLVIIIGGIFFIFNSGVRSVYASDTTIRGNFRVEGNKKIILKNNAHLTVQGDMTIDGMVSCDGGSLSLIVLGKLKVTGTLYCALDEHSKTTIPNMALALTAKHIEFSKEAEVAVNGRVMIISDKHNAPVTEGNIESIFEESGQNTGTDTRIGPFIKSKPSQKIITESGEGKRAAPDANFVLRGNWHIGDGEQFAQGMVAPLLPANAPLHIFYINAGERGDLVLDDFTMSGPLGNDGSDDVSTSCNAKGLDGAKGGRIRALSSRIIISNTSIHLGSGGKGGNALAKPNCANATAVGGDGGEAGNLKLSATETITIHNFVIIPGKGGGGGDATATGKNAVDGCGGSEGGSTDARGGKGSENKEALAVAGRLENIENITMGRVSAGAGGRADARGGSGGNGNSCGCAGGNGGNAIAIGGDGGDTLVFLPVGTAEAHGGNGGDTKARGGNGGGGGNCPDTSSLGEQAKGGNGGDGGKGEAKSGNGGSGTTGRGNQGKTIDRSGGKGGPGGDACISGLGGKGGLGFPIGENGLLGKALCISTATSVPPTNTQSPIMIKAILYHGKYLPIDQLTVEDLAGCDEKYWHSLSGQVTATDGSIVLDSLFTCGFGKVKVTRAIDTLSQTATAIKQGGRQ